MIFDLFVLPVLLTYLINKEAYSEDNFKFTIKTLEESRVF